MDDAPLAAPPLNCIVLTTSDSRTLKTDRGGAYAQEVLERHGHKVVSREIVADEVGAIRGQVLEAVELTTVDVLVITGGTGLGPRDVTPDAVVPLFGKTLPGFGETLRRLTFERWGARALLSRATAGTIARTLVFLLPGAPEAVRVAVDELIVPSLADACQQLGRLELSELTRQLSR